MDKDYFEKYIDYLDKLYVKDPVKAVDKAEYFLNKLTGKISILSKLDDKKKDIFFICIISILMVLTGFIRFMDPSFISANEHPISQALAGVLLGLPFFLSGLLFTLYMGAEGFLLLLSHGIIGFYFMIVDVYYDIKPLLSDGLLTTPYVSTTILILLFSFLLTIIYGLVPKYREIKHIKPIIMLFYLLSLILIKALPYKLG